MSATDSHMPAMSNESKPSGRIIGGDVALTHATQINAASARRIALEIGFLTALKTIWTQPMRRFGAACVWLQHKGDASHPYSLKFVALLLSIPCFQVSNFCFERVYAANLRHMRIIGLDCAGLSASDGDLKFNNLRTTLCRIVDGPERLGDIKSGLETVESCGDFEGCHDDLRRKEASG